MKAFLEELRTHHIYRIAAGYMVSSWLILQIASLLCSALGLPNWTLKAVLALLLVGFGAALIIGWRIDLRAARLAAGGSRLRSRKVHFVLWPAAAIFIVGGAILVLSAFLDANQASKLLSSKVQSSAPATESATSIPARQASWASFNEAERQFQLGEWKEAIALLARAIKFDPANQVASERFFQELIVHRQKALPPLIASFAHQDHVFQAVFS